MGVVVAGQPVPVSFDVWLGLGPPTDIHGKKLKFRKHRQHTLNAFRWTDRGIANVDMRS